MPSVAFKPLSVVPPMAAVSPSQQLALPFAPLKLTATAATIETANASALTRASARFANKASEVIKLHHAQAKKAEKAARSGPDDISSDIDYAPYLKRAGDTVRIGDFTTKPKDRFGLSKDDPRVAAFLTAAPVRFNAVKKLMNAAKTRKVLIITQGLDGQGKGALLEALGITLPGANGYAFKKPTDEETKEHYLDRIRRQMPKDGEIAIFDRSYMEDYIVPVTLGLLSPEEAAKRLQELADFEREFEESGGVIIRLYANASKDQQFEDLMERTIDPNTVDDPEEKLKVALRNLKLATSDWRGRANRDAYIKANEEGMSFAEWLVVPNDMRWFGRVVALKYVLDRLEALVPDLQKDVFERARETRESFFREIKEKGIELK